MKIEFKFRKNNALIIFTIIMIIIFSYSWYDHIRTKIHSVIRIHVQSHAHRHKLRGSVGVGTRRPRQGKSFSFRYSGADHVRTCCGLCEPCGCACVAFANQPSANPAACII